MHCTPLHGACKMATATLQIDRTMYNLLETSYKSASRLGSFCRDLLLLAETLLRVKWPANASFYKCNTDNAWLRCLPASSMFPSSQQLR